MYDRIAIHDHSYCIALQKKILQYQYTVASLAHNRFYFIKMQGTVDMNIQLYIRCQVKIFPVSCQLPMSATHQGKPYSIPPSTRSALECGYRGYISQCPKVWINTSEMPVWASIRKVGMGHTYWPGIYENFSQKTMACHQRSSARYSNVKPTPVPARVNLNMVWLPGKMVYYSKVNIIILNIIIFIVYIKYCNNYSKVLCAVLVAESYLCKLLMQMIMRRKPRVVLKSCHQKMVMAHLWAGLCQRDLACRFSVSQSTASWIWITWVNFIFHSKPYQCGPLQPW